VADGDEAVQENDGGGFLGMVGAALSGAASVAGEMWDLSAPMARDELSQALQAFPDGISSGGDMFSGTGMGADQAADVGMASWPAEIADNSPVAQADNGNAQGYDAGASM
jgi:hypothetical protein